MVEAKIPLYKHTIAAYATTIIDLPQQIVYGSWGKFHHVILAWPHHLTTLFKSQLNKFDSSGTQRFTWC